MFKQGVMIEVYMILVIKHIAIEGPGIIADFFQDHKWQIKIVELQEGDWLPNKFSDIEAIIVLGGPMNVGEEDKYPFLKNEDAFIRQALKEEVPLLGICLGAQLLAKAAGAAVTKAREKELGWCQVALTDSGAQEPLFKNIAKSFDVFQWHEDTFDLPDSATLLASSSVCPNQAFKLGKNAYGLQFHIEVTSVMVQSWVKEYLDPDNKEDLYTAREMAAGAQEKKEQYLKRANQILSNFTRVIAG